MKKNRIIIPLTIFFLIIIQGALGALTDDNLVWFSADNTTTRMTFIGDIEGRNGKINGSIDFEQDDADEYIDLGPGTGERNQTEFSVSLWFQRETSDGYDGIISARSSAVNDNWALDFASNKLEFAIGTGASTVVVESDSTITDTNWHHAVAVYNESGTSYLYLDGVKQADSDTNNINWNHGLSTIIGRFYTQVDDYYMDGLIDEIIIYDEALTESEVLLLNQTKRSLVSATILEHLDMDNLHDSTTEDRNITTSATGFNISTNGKLGPSFGLDGAVGAGTFSETGFPTGTNDRTVAFWAYPHSTVAEYQLLFSYGSASTNQRWSVGFQQSTGKWFVTDEGQILSSTSDYSLNEWVHVTVSFDGTNHVIYINGTLEVNNSATITGVNTQLSAGGWIGKQSDGWFYNGLIDEIGFWDRVLNGTEIAELYNSRNAYNPYAPLPPVEGNTSNATIYAYDSSDNSAINNFTIRAINANLSFNEEYTTTVGQINVSDTNMTNTTTYNITIWSTGYETTQSLNYDANSLLNISMNPNNMSIHLDAPIFADRWNQNSSDINFTYTINGAATNPTCFLYTNEDATWDHRNNQTATMNQTNNMFGLYNLDNSFEGTLTWNIMCDNNGEESWGINDTIVIDKSVPSMLLLNENFDGVGDTTTLSVWDNITFSINMTDTYLHSYEINCTLHNDTVWINDAVNDLNITNYITNISKSLANISVNNYEPLTCEGIVWDDHTDNKWLPKEVYTDADEIRVDLITVKLENWFGDNTPLYTIEEGKLGFEFTNTNIGEEQELKVFCDDEDFRLRSQSNYEAHMTCGKMWIDFENPDGEEAEIEEGFNYWGLGRKHYTVKIKTAKFDSIGGLNNNTFSFSVNISSDVHLNITRENDRTPTTEPMNLTLDGINLQSTQNFSFYNVTQMYLQLTGHINGTTIQDTKYINTTGQDNYTESFSIFYPEFSFIDQNNGSIVLPSCRLETTNNDITLPTDYDYASWNTTQNGTLYCDLWAYHEWNQTINFSLWDYTDIEVKPKYLNLTFTELINGSIIGTDPAYSYTLTNTNNTYYEMRNLSSGLNIVAYGPSLQLYHFTNDYNTTYQDTLTVITADLEKPIAVYSTYGEAIEDAYVVSAIFEDGEWLQTYSTYTDGDGQTSHKYDDNNVYLITVTADGYVTHTEATYIATGDTNTLVIRMVPTTAGQQGWNVLVNTVPQNYMNDTNYTIYYRAYDENVNITINLTMDGEEVDYISC